MPRMTAVKPHDFGHGPDKHRVEGDQYDANDQEANLLRALGWARDASGEAQAAAGTAPKAEPATRGRRTYNRRDMRATDE